MYRINIYPEFALRRAETRLRRIRTSVLMALVAVEVLVVAALLTSGFLLSEQARNMRASVDRLTRQLEEDQSPSEALATARQMVTIRRSRLDWSPKLAAVSQTIDPSLIMMRVSGEASPKKEHRMVLDGRVRSGRPPLETITTFLEALRADERVADDFGSISLGNLRGGGSERFQLVCKMNEVTGAKK